MGILQICSTDDLTLGNPDRLVVVLPIISMNKRR
jgi:hypothetical protein